MSDSKRLRTQRKKNDFWLPKLVGLIFMLAGGIVLFFGIRPLLKASEAIKWPTVSGKITTSDTTSGMANNKGKTTKTYGVEVVYEYDVEGKRYSSDVVAFGVDRFHDSDSASRVIKKYPAGSEVKVAFDSKNPEMGVLEPGIQKRALILPGGGLAFVLGGCFLYFLIPGDMERKRAETLGESGNS